jgi:hypothetical protein
MELPEQLAYDGFADVVRGDGRVVITLDTRNDEDDIAVVLAAVQRYNTHTAHEQVLADVAELATQLARSLTNYNEAYALVRQIRATLKKARERA